MDHLDLYAVVPDKFTGSKIVRVAQGPGGPRDYVQGRGADMVPSKTGPGDVFIAPDDFQGDALTFTNVNEAGKSAILRASQQIVADGLDLTHRNVLEALAGKSL
ncbi:MAG: hypothetical protein AAB953_02710 [Patescibacteria group bacterium]